MQFYNSDCGFHDAKVNYEDICSHQNVEMFYLSLSISQDMEYTLW